MKTLELADSVLLYDALLKAYHVRVAGQFQIGSSCSSGCSSCGSDNDGSGCGE